MTFEVVPRITMTLVLFPMERLDGTVTVTTRVAGVVVTVGGAVPFTLTFDVEIDAGIVVPDGNVAVIVLTPGWSAPIPPVLNEIVYCARVLCWPGLGMTVACAVVVEEALMAYELDVTFVVSVLVLAVRVYDPAVVGLYTPAPVVNTMTTDELLLIVTPAGTVIVTACPATETTVVAVPFTVTFDAVMAAGTVVPDGKVMVIVLV